MTNKFKTGQVVVVRFQGRKHQGEVIAVSKRTGYVMCRIIRDPLWDYGSINARLDPEPTVCVKDSDVRHADAVTPPKVSPQ
jgi:hypothetical protein